MKSLTSLDCLRLNNQNLILSPGSTALTRALPIEATDNEPKIKAPIDGMATHNGLSVVGIMPFLIRSRIATHAAVRAVVCHPLAFSISNHFESAGFIDIQATPFEVESSYVFLYLSRGRRVKGTLSVADGTPQHSPRGEICGVQEGSLAPASCYSSVVIFFWHRVCHFCGSHRLVCGYGEPQPLSITYRVKVTL
jgi:hypothetical protein